LAKIIPINQRIIDAYNSALSSVDERFRNMSFQERNKHYQNYLNVREMIEDLLKKANEEAETYMHHDI